MRQAVVLGNPDTKRTHYLGRAAREAGLHVLFLNWDRWRENFPQGKVFLKVDPPVWGDYSLELLGKLVENYREQLEELGRLARLRDVEFFNEPEAITALLDKKGCKARLVTAGLAVSEEIRPDGRSGSGGDDSEKERSVKAGDEAPGAGQQPEAEFKSEAGRQPGAGLIGNGEELLEIMRTRRVYQVFIKPLCGSGAAGVAAFRWHPGTGRMVLYTCARVCADGEGKAPGSGLVNTKRLQKIVDSGQALSMADRLLRLGCIVERWYAKAEYQGFSYDLRAVMQDGRMDFCLARLSRGPITNLHLNNHPLKLGMLGLSGQVSDEIGELCRNAMRCFPGLRSAGIDILLERGSLRPRIIEMNAQGDLIYQDIYAQNLIYRHQAEMMKMSCSR